MNYLIAGYILSGLFLWGYALLLYLEHRSIRRREHDAG